jgi:hypothetical protein
LRDEEVTLFSKFRDVGNGVKWPYTIQRQRTGEKIYEIFSDSVAMDQGLGADLFILPSAIKVLPEKIGTK